MATSKTTKTQKTTEQTTWTNIKGVMRVWGKEFEYGKGKSFISYSTSVGIKNKDGEYKNVYYDVRFRKDEAPDIIDDFIIDVKKGFLTVSTAKDGRRYPAVMIIDYEVKE